MKKLLSILTIPTLTASVPAPLLANTTLTIVKRDVSTLTSNSNNDYLPIKQINGASCALSIAADSKDNIYFGTSDGLFVLKQGQSTPTKINGIDGNTNSILVDINDNIYFGTDKGAYIMQAALSRVKTNINLDFIDKSKNIVWSRDDQLVANRQVKVKIANTNIETIKVNGKEMSQTNKVWEFGLPIDITTFENKDYQIEIAFKVDGKSYIGQIIVSSLLLQPSINVKKILR